MSGIWLRFFLCLPRFNLLTEMVQATQLDNLNSAKGQQLMDPTGIKGSPTAAPSTDKLKLYIQQLVSFLDAVKM